ncbi:hypothetical protein Tco_1316520 [Tanacetum coccineum]
MSLSNNIEKIEEMLNPKHMSSESNNITLAIRNAKYEIVYVICKQCLVTANHDVCVLNYVNDMNSRADNQSANVSIRKNQKKHKANQRNEEFGNTENKSEKSVCDNASTSNPSEPTSKGFLIYTSLLDRVGKVIPVICSTYYSNGENQVVSKSSAVITADASDERQ